MRLALAFVLSASSLLALDTVSVATVPDIAYENGEVPARFRLSLGAPATAALPVTVTIGGTAFVAADYALSGPIVGSTVTIPIGASFVDVVVTPEDDGLIERRETVILTIETSPGYLRGPQFSATMLIADDDLRLSWTPIKTDVAEYLQGASPPEAAVRLSFNADPGAAVDVQYQLLDVSGAAELGNDYFMTLMLRTDLRDAGETILTSNILLDRCTTLSPTAETWTVGAKVASAVTKPNNIIPLYDATKLEAGDLVQFGTSTTIYRIFSVDHGTHTLTLSTPTEENISKDAVVRNNLDATIVSNGDVQGVSVDSQYGVDIAITPKYDNEAEGGETVTMRLLSSPDYHVESPTDMQLVLADDDVLVSVVAVKDAVETPSTTGVVRLNLSAPAPRNLTIPIDIATGSSAVSGTDYVAIDDEVLVPQGSTGVDISVIPMARAGTQGDRTLSVTLIDTTDIVLTGSGGSAGAVAVINIRDGTAVANFGTVTIQSPSDQASDADPAVAASLRVRVARTGASNPDIVVPITISGSAVPTLDYEALPTSVTLPGLLAASDAAAGSSFVQVVLATSTTEVVLPAGSTLRIGTSTSVTLSTAATVGTAPVYVQLTAALSAPVPYGTSIGVNSVELAVTPISDSEDEADELVNVTLTQPGDANFAVGAPSTGSVTIVDSLSAGPEEPVIDPKPPVGSGSASSGGCGAGAASGLLLAGLGLAFALRRRRAA